MPRGLNRTDLNKTGTSYKDGTPITLPHEFGNVVNWTPDPAHFGNPVTQGNDPTQFGNPVTWTPDPAHFGNIFAPASPANFQTITAVYDASTPVSDLSAPNQSFTITFSTPSPLTGNVEDPGIGFFVNGITIHYVSGSFDMMFSNVQLEYFNLASLGGMNVGNGVDISFNGHTYGWQFFNSVAAQYYSGTDANPTLTPGTYSNNEGAFNFDGSTATTFNPTYNVVINSPA